jgi:hypothetical protein
MTGISIPLLTRINTRVVLDDAVTASVITGEIRSGYRLAANPIGDAMNMTRLQSKGECLDNVTFQPPNTFEDA